MLPQYLLALPAYALGIFPTALLVAGLVGKDPTKEGSGNPGATNVARTVGWRAGVLVLLGDVSKGAMATWFGFVVGGRTVGLVCGTAAVVGHIFPVSRGFNGGKGVATAIGFAAVGFPLEALVAGLAWLVISASTRRVSLGSIVLVAALPVASSITGRPIIEVTLLAGMAMLVIIRHRDNVIRLLRGEEAAFELDNQ